MAEKETVAWFSAGCTSAVACKLALKKHPDLKILYIETGSHHPDNMRFLHDCEKWYGREIQVLQSAYYKDVFDCIERTQFINAAWGASCTSRLKVDVRKRYEYEHDIGTYIWGFEYDKKEIRRSKRMVERYPDFVHEFPLIEEQLDKPSCLSLLQQAGIELPVLYKLGYKHNNCICCVKGSKGWWNKVRVDFPEYYDRMAKLEREIGHSCLPNCFLDELDPDAGRGEAVEPACSIFCGMIDLEDNETKD